jgi:hypothetical protein
MKITLDPSLDARHQSARTSSVLSAWYDATPAILRLWAIQPQGTSETGAMRVVVMLAPSLDGDDTSLAWMANGTVWANELRGRLAGAVQLEQLDGPLPEEFEIDGEGVVLSSLCWRDDSFSQD